MSLLASVNPKVEPSVEYKSDGPHPWERMNSGLYKINMVDKGSDDDGAS